MSDTTTIHDSAAFQGWLKANDGTHAQLLDLCMTGFVSHREAEEPHRQILGALSNGGNRYTEVKALARRVADLLSAFPRLDFPLPGEEETPSPLQYEVLSLAAALDCPEILEGPLLQCEATLRTAGISLPLSVRGAFMEALTRQQSATAPLRDCWLRMAGGGSDALLGDSPEFGMQGLFMIPDAQICGPGRPGVDRKALGEGLLAYAAVCKPDKSNRRQDFRRMIARIRGLWSLPRTYFIMLAHDFKWVENGHGWAVDALPELFVECFGEFGTGTEHCWLVWSWFVRALEPWGVVHPVEPATELCGGRIKLVQFSKSQSALCQKMVRDFQKLESFGVEVSENDANAVVSKFFEIAAEGARKEHEDRIAECLEKIIVAYSTEQAREVITVAA